MSRFVRVREVEIGDDDFFILNLDLVASVTLSKQEDMVPGSKTPGAFIEVKSAAQSVLAAFYLTTFEEGKHWVLKHFGVDG